MVAQKTILQNAYETTLSTAVGATATEVTLTVASAPVGSPSASTPMYLVIDPDSDATREYVKVTSRSGATLTVVRNIDTDSGGLNAHAVGAKVRMVAMKQHFDELNDRVDTIINSDGTAVVTTGVVKDEDDLVSDSDTHLATQQSIKAYVDSQVASKDDLSELTGTTDDVTEGSTNLYFTTERVDDQVAALLTEGSNITLTYDDTAGTLTITAVEDDLSNNTTSDLAEGTNLYFTAERVDDQVNTLLTEGSNITLTYDDTAGTLTIAATEDDLSNNNTDDLAEGTTNLYYTVTRANSAIDARVTKAFVDALNVDADTLDGNDSTAFATSAQGTLADSALQSGDNVSELTNDAGYLTTIDLTGESIDELSDVDTSTSAPTDGQALLWSSTDSEWQPGDVASSTAAKIIDADGDTQIQTEESADEDILRFDTAGVERATLQGALDLTDDGGAFIHSQTQAGTYTVASGKGTLFAGPITITGTVTNAGTMVVI
jgi:ribulose bisphosphate carboxylase small subunit